MDQSDFIRMFAYDGWANHEVIASVEKTSAPTGKPLRLLAHLIAAQWVWLDRLLGRKQSIAVWPELSLDECRAHLQRLDSEWDAYLTSLTPVKLDSQIAYANSKGEAWTSSVADILLHVSMHGVYHRGQIALEVRAAGHTPVYTDFIHAVRQGHIGI